MPAVRVIPRFNEFEDRHLGFAVRPKAALCEQFAFERRKEALAHRVIVAVGNVPIDGRTPVS